jgi:hypothetical protein
MRSLTGDVGSAFRRGFAWWTGELKSILPASLSRDASRPKADIVVVVSGGRITAALPDPQADGPVEDAIVGEITRRAEREPAKVRLRLPAAECLVRELSVPKVAINDVERIAALDLERATPFRTAEVHTAVLVDRARRSATTVGAKQIVVKRAKLASIRARLEAAGAEIVGADCYWDDPGQPLPIDFFAAPGSTAEKSHTGFVPSYVLAAVAGSLAVAALLIATWRHESALAALREEAAGVRARIAEARGRIGSSDAALLDALATFKSSRPPVVVLLEDLARRLPDTAYLTELRLSDRTLEIAGYGRPVRGVAPELERSPYVESASISAPFVTDDNLQKERFGLRVELRSEAGAGEAATPLDLPPPGETQP